MKKLALCAGLLAVVLLAGCTAEKSASQTDAAPEIVYEKAYSEAEAVTVSCKRTAVSCDSDAVSWEDGVLKISQPGTYVLSGQLTGQILAKHDGGIVRLVLRNLDVKSDAGPALTAKKLDKLIVTVENSASLTDSLNYTFDDGENEPDACLYSKCDLEINGYGTLTVDGKYAHGIRGKDSLSIDNLTCRITAAKSGIKGKDSVAIKSAVLSIQAGTDGIHSDGDMLLEPRNITISSGDDGIHAERDLSISGNVEISDSKEGIEAQNITILGGSISIRSTDDGLNAVSPDDRGTCTIRIAGGLTTVDAGGDGVDANGQLIVEGGELTVYGPTNNGNGALDADQGCTVTGGKVLALGTSGMAMGFENSSQQCSFMVRFDGKAGKELLICDSDGSVLCRAEPAKAYENVVFSCPELQIGETYTISSNGKSASVTLTDITTGYSGLHNEGFGGKGDRPVPGGQPGPGQMPEQRPGEDHRMPPEKPSAANQ